MIANSIYDRRELSGRRLNQYGASPFLRGDQFRFGTNFSSSRKVQLLRGAARMSAAPSRQMAVPSASPVAFCKPHRQYRRRNVDSVIGGKSAACSNRSDLRQKPPEHHQGGNAEHQSCRRRADAPPAPDGETPSDFGHGRERIDERSRHLRRRSRRAPSDIRNDRATPQAPCNRRYVHRCIREPCVSIPCAVPSGGPCAAPPA